MDEINSIDGSSEIKTTKQEFLTDPNKPVFDPAILSMPGKEIIPQGGPSDNNPTPTLPPGPGGDNKRWTYDGDDFKFKIGFAGNESADHKKGESIRFYADLAT